MLARTGRSVDIDTVKAFLGERIANYKTPKTWSVLDAFASLPNDKASRKTLRTTLAVGDGPPGRWLYQAARRHPGRRQHRQDCRWSDTAGK